MKKGLVILLAVAVLGGLGGYLVTRDDSPTSIAQESQTQTSSGSSQGNYKDGSYTSKVSETLYGNIQIAIVVANGNITDVRFLQMPDKDDGRSRRLTEMAKPLLKASTIEKQSDQIDFVTGATSTSFGYQESLQSALDKAAQS